jgi:putative ATPase
LHEIEENGPGPIPVHLMDSSRDARGLGHGQGYDYPHDHEDHWTPQQYLPEGLIGTQYYQPSDQGYESQVKDRLRQWREAQAKALEDLRKEAVRNQ